MNKKSIAIEFWKFFFAIGFAFFTLNTVFLTKENSNISNLLSGGKVLEFFLILAGFYMVSSYKDLKEENVEKISTWKYIRTKLKKLYPAILGGVFITFIARNFVIKTSISHLPGLVVGALFELLGISQLGLVSYVSKISNDSLIQYIVDGGINIIWNEPCIYLSSIIIVSLLLFYFLAKNEDFYKSIVCPLVIICGYGTLNYLGEYNPLTNSFLGIPSSLIRVAAAMAIGSILYYLVNYIKNRKFNNSLKFIITFLNVLLIVYFVWSFVYGVSWNEFFNIIFIIPFMIISFVGEDFISKTIDNNFSKYLGNLSLYIFSSHVAFAYLIPYLFNYLSFNYISVIYLIIVIVWANVMYAVDNLIVTPLFREK